MPPKKVKVIKVKFGQFQDNPDDEKTRDDVKTCHESLTENAVHSRNGKRGEFDHVAKEVARVREQDDSDVTLASLYEEYQDTLHELTDTLIYFCRVWIETNAKSKNRTSVYKLINDMESVILALENRFRVCGLTVKTFDYLSRVQLELDKVSENFSRKKLKAVLSLQEDWNKLQKEIKDMGTPLMALAKKEQLVAASGHFVHVDTKEYKEFDVWKRAWKHEGMSEAVKKTLERNVDGGTDFQSAQYDATIIPPAIYIYYRLVRYSTEARLKGWIQ